MAKNNKQQEEIQNPPFTVDWTKLAPGITEADIRKTGQLTAMYLPAEALTKKWPPIVVDLVGIETWATVVKNGKPWTPRQLRGVLVTPAKAIGGTGDAAQEVDLKPGDDILIPITGNLSVNKEILLAAAHEKLLFRAGFAVTGMQETKNGDMHVWEAPILGKPQQRSGRFLQIGQPTELPQMNGKTSDGTVYDKATGEVAKAVTA